jgi:hypothetical protein
MIQAAVQARTRTTRGPIVKLLYPSLRVRFYIAVLLTFFPFGILYRLEYPMAEILILASWIWVFPSVAGCLVLGLLPLVANATYGYYAFNLLCLGATLATGYAASHCAKFQIQLTNQLYSFTRICVFLAIGICVLQVLSPPEMWYAIFPNMSLGEAGGRGAGLRSEPSLLAGPFSIYLGLLVLRVETMSVHLRQPEVAMRRKRLLREGAVLILLILLLTRSISVLAIVVCFLPSLMARRRKLILPVLAAGIGFMVTMIVFGDRVRAALRAASGSVTDLATVAVGSWRSVPDLIILSNYRDFLLPGNPSEIRTKLNGLAVMFNPLFAWLENTYSTFAAGATTIGLIATGSLFIGGLVLGIKLLPGRKAIRLTWVLIYIANWLLTPKFEAAGWIVLGIMLRAGALAELDTPSASTI